MDEITVTLPHERPFGAVAGLVLGGVAARHDVTLEALDDLRLALETLVEHDEGEDELNVVLRVDDGIVHVAVGPFEPEAVAELEDEAGDELGLRRVLDAVVDGVSVDARADGSWVAISKGYTRAGANGR